MTIVLDIIIKMWMAGTILAFALFPSEMGEGYHIVYNKFMQGWESVK